MSQLPCEICGCTDFTKQSGFYICNNCDTQSQVSYMLFHYKNTINQFFYILQVASKKYNDCIFQNIQEQSFNFEDSQIYVNEDTEIILQKSQEGMLLQKIMFRYFLYYKESKIF